MGKGIKVNGLEERSKAKANITIQMEQFMKEILQMEKSKDPESLHSKMALKLRHIGIRHVLKGLAKFSMKMVTILKESTECQRSRGKACTYGKEMALVMKAVSTKTAWKAKLEYGTHSMSTIKEGS